MVLRPRLAKADPDTQSCVVAWADAGRLARSRGGRVIAAAITVGVSEASAFALGAPVWLKVLLVLIGAIAAAPFLLRGLLFAPLLLIAPYRQRNQARAEREQVRAERDETADRLAHLTERLPALRRTLNELLSETGLLLSSYREYPGRHSVNSARADVRRIDERVRAALADARMERYDEAFSGIQPPDALDTLPAIEHALDLRLHRIAHVLGTVRE